MITTRLVLPALTLMFMFGVLVVPPAATAQSKGSDGQIKIYMSGPGSLAGRLEKAFEKDRGDVLSVLNAGGGSLAKRIWAEKAAGKIHVDVLLSSEPVLFLALKRENLLEKYVSPETAAFRDDYLFGDGYFTPVNARYGVIVYSTANVAVSEIPESFADLKKPHWKNRLAFADATQSSTALALNAGIFQAFGNSWELQEAMRDNNVMLLTRNSAVATKVKTGEVDAGIIPHDGVLRSIKKDKKDGITSPLTISWPKEGAISLQRPVGIIANPDRPAKNGKIAREFVDFVLSVEGQKIASRFGFISVRKDVDPPSGVPADIKKTVVDWQQASKDEQKLRAAFEEIIAGR